MSRKFYRDLQLGKLYEKKALNYFKYKCVEYPPEGAFKEYDFILHTDNNNKIKVEVKSDTLGYKTKNIVIEYECYNKPSGITTSEADFWIYFLIHPEDENKNEVYKIPTNELKEICKGHKYVCGGDNKMAKLYLLKSNELLNFKVEKIN